MWNEMIGSGFRVQGSRFYTHQKGNLWRYDPGFEDFRNLNFQAPNPKEIPNSKNQWPKQVCHFEFWSLWFICYLLFAIWNFSSKLKSFFLDQTGCLQPAAGLNPEPKSFKGFPPRRDSPFRVEGVKSSRFKASPFPVQSMKIEVIPLTLNFWTLNPEPFFLNLWTHIALSRCIFYRDAIRESSLGAG